MIEVRCVRLHRRDNIWIYNYRLKGQFIMRFNSIDELVNYSLSAKNVCFVNPEEVLTKEQMRTFMIKRKASLIKRKRRM